ncbi:MAG: serpin family protein, partial [Planctomycetaceae bacterium]|nr:serpin family protein [Planctomycetaceae bacterium]
KTQGLIPNAAPPLSGDEQVVLLGTLYFKALWQTMFETRDINPEGEFTLTSGEVVRTPMMSSSKGDFLHTENEDCLVLEMPFMKSTYSMVFLLPRTPQGIYELERKLDADNLAALLETLTGGATNVTIPKFHIEQEIDFKTFLPEIANLSGLIGNGLLTSAEVVQKTVLGIDEHGIEAASTFYWAYVSLGDKGVFEFHARHPFLFLVRDRTSGTIFFIGKLMDPCRCQSIPVIPLGNQVQTHRK